MTAHRIVPITIFTILVLLFAVSLYHPQQNSLQSPLVGIPLPQLHLPELGSTKIISPNDSKDTWLLLNLFASWCEPCRMEHPLLMKLAQDHRITIYGLAWRNAPPKALQWLQEHGNPYQKVMEDPQGTSTSILGVTGVPETYLVDSNGIVIHKFTGPLTQDDIDNILLPMMKTSHHAP